MVEKQEPPYFALEKQKWIDRYNIWQWFVFWVLLVAGLVVAFSQSENRTAHATIGTMCLLVDYKGKGGCAETVKEAFGMKPIELEANNESKNKNQSP
jgi:hypothetical protein